MVPADPDAQLMVAFQRGNDAAFEHILGKYQRGIVNFIYRIVNNRHEAEEVAQDVFLKVYASRATYEPRARFASWIFRIAVNAALKAAERKRRSPIRLSGGRDGGEEHEWAAADTRPGPEAELAARETEAVVKAAISALPLKERIAVTLRRYEELSYVEIAQVMNCSEAAVKTYIHRAKLHLRERLLPYMEKGNL